MERRLFRTGFAIAVPEGFECQVRPRSGLALKHGITLPNTPATIDSDYRGELQVILVNLGAEPFEITRGMRIAQLVIARVEPAEFRETRSCRPPVAVQGGSEVRVGRSLAPLGMSPVPTRTTPMRVQLPHTKGHV